MLAGTWRVRVEQKSGYKLTTPTAGYHSFTLAKGQAKTGVLFGEKPV